VLGGVALQFFLAGLGAFGATSIGPHAMLGTLLALLGLVLLILAAVAKAKVGPTAALFGLLVLQILLPEIGKGLSAPVISALHPVNAVLVLGTAHHVARGIPGGGSATAERPAARSRVA